MSNWSKSTCKTLENIEAEYLEKALARMSLYADFETKTVSRVYEGDRQPCDALLRNISDHSSANIGLKFAIQPGNDGSENVKMTVQADWWGNKWDEKSFMDTFTIEYTTAKAIELARTDGFSVTEEVSLEDGRRRLVMSRVA